MSKSIPCLLNGLLCASLLAGCAHSASRARPAGAEQPAAQPAAVISLRVDQVISDGQRQALRPGAVLKAGESLALQVEVEGEAYVAVMEVGPDGKAERVYPGPGEGEALVRSGQRVDLPPPGEAFRLQGAGRQTFYVVASTRPIEQADPGLARKLTQGAGAAVQDGNAAFPTRSGADKEDPKAPPPPPDKLPTPVEPDQRGVPLSSVGATLRMRTDEGGVAILRFWVEVR